MEEARVIRRDYVTLMAQGLLALQISPLGGLIHTRSASAQTDPDLRHDIEGWMNEWMGVERTPVGALHLSRFKDPTYFLLVPIIWKPNLGQDDLPEVHVPKGFVTDLTSVPRIFWSLLRPDGDYTYPAIIHDFLYWTQDLTRPTADSIFRFAMEDFEIDPTTTAAIYNAVRLAGQSAWDENTVNKARGEKRVLKRYPQDPRITWAQWKVRPDVFN